MKLNRTVILAGAAVGAVALALIAHSLVSGKPTHQAAAAPVVHAGEPQTRVLVAGHDLRVGDRLTASDMDWQSWPQAAVNAAWTTDGSIDAAPLASGKAGDQAKALAQKAGDALQSGGPKAQFVDAVVREAMLKGEPLVTGKLVRAGQTGYMSVVLAPGMRAMAVTVTVESAAGGFVLPGDRVDVLLSGQSDGATRTYFSGTVLRNVKVLAIDQSTQADKDKQAVVGATATLELTPADAQALALAKAEGTLSLTLRSYADINGPSGRVVTTAAAVDHTVKVYRNGEASEVTVSR